MTDAGTSNEANPEELPFSCEFEVGVQEAGQPDEWEWYHPRAKSESEARTKAMDKAETDGMMSPVVYEVYGPIKPSDPIRVGEDMIEEVFGQ